MKTGVKGLALIKKEEQFMAKAYYCPAHILTIGYGHVIQKGEEHLKTAVLTEPEAAALLAKDLARYEAAVTGAIKVPLTQNQFDACVTMCYNIGTTGFATSNLVKKINERAPEAVIRPYWEVWNKMDGTRNRKDDDKDGLVDEAGEKQVAPGLVRRRANELALYFSK
ncbi:lysozyme [Hymenobacter chitinivorans]|uniref:Lysozyme n=1 Tax=Hymenobacter chitinivorans DSM 11115 TaxID=1121954 RepID=A0A2M9BNC4_9BACT|nr:lysozyme [Hymenobacter chitinivorans]PJJ59442.1 GH24 family phage-related lysozyme (muramidase) [Hymenobacter chitinivorans DSM 11115]